MKPLTYLMCPYSHHDPEVMQFRFHSANRAAAWLINHGWNVYSPLSHSVPIAEYLGNGNDSGFWVDLDMEFIYHCQCAHVLKLPGWKESSGIKRELEVAENIGIEVFYLEPEEEYVYREL